MWFPAFCVFCVLQIFNQASCEVDYSAFEDITQASLEKWITALNAQYQILNQFSASFAWGLSVDPKKDLYEKASEFGGLRSRWRNMRCSEAKKYVSDMNGTEKRMIYLLCRGPKYTDYQASELSEILTRIQDIYTETQICLPTGFDVCLNYDRIWEFTYIRTVNDEVTPLDMTAIEPDMGQNLNSINYFDGKLSEGYYIYRGEDKNLNAIETEKLIRRTPEFCLNIEPELEKLMSGNLSNLKRTDCALPADTIFRWAWEAWRLAVGPPIGQLYPSAIYLMNVGAQNNEYHDIGECWREELEMDNLRDTVNKLWKGVKPFYKLLHAVVRSALWNKYEGDDIFLKKGPLPAHILGNMWSQDWSAYHKLLLPLSKINIDDNFKETNWTSIDMVTLTPLVPLMPYGVAKYAKFSWHHMVPPTNLSFVFVFPKFSNVSRADDFYSSMGLNPMTEKFWRFSKFEKTSKNSKCHGSAANMFEKGDYRMIVCADRTIDDFYVIIHEMGHIQYYMHLETQPPIFQDAANSAIGETIGDTMFLAMMVPQQLNRLGLLSDRDLYPAENPYTRINELRLVHGTKAKREYFQAPSDYELYTRTKNSANNSQTHKHTFNGSKLHVPPITLFGEPFPDFTELNERVKNYFNLQSKYEYSPSAVDLSLLLRLALSKIPQIPFEYILDTFRWDFFAGKVSFEDANDYFWELSLTEQGIRPPGSKNRHNLFDPAAKFHLADNTPYVRYFLASFLQVQVLKGLCEKTVFGRVNPNEKLPMPLHRCDIYGSKRAGNLLKKAMKLGASVHWTEVLYILTGKREISIEPLLEFYQPLIKWLEKLVVEFDIPVGW